ncbi:MAG: TlpA family protein disulfide reductase [Actinomycetota bacterium]|nr:TlpA family protein disulfide reductase [Actinomycetota bacterium]
MTADGAGRSPAWLRVAVVAAGVAVVAAVGLLAFRGGGGAGSIDAAGFDLPAVQSDTRVKLVDFRGRPVVVNFYASWCTSCDFELPGFARVSEELRDRVTFVGVNSLETGDPMYMPERHGITWWPLARDVGGGNGSGLLGALGAGNAMPVTAFYDADGKLLRVDRAALPESTLRSRLRDLYGI